MRVIAITKLAILGRSYGSVCYLVPASRTLGAYTTSVTLNSFVAHNTWYGVLCASAGTKLGGSYAFGVLGGNEGIHETNHPAAYLATGCGLHRALYARAHEVSSAQACMCGASPHTPAFYTLGLFDMQNDGGLACSRNRPHARQPKSKPTLGRPSF